MPGWPPSGPRVGAGVDRSDPLPRQVRVELGRGDTRMTEQLLNDPQIRPALEQMRRERVTQCVRADPVTKPGAPSGDLHRCPRLLPGESTPAVPDEQRTAAWRGDVSDGEEHRARLVEPAAEPVQCDIADGDHPLAVPLADDTDEPAVE